MGHSKISFRSVMSTFFATFTITMAVFSHSTKNQRTRKRRTVRRRRRRKTNLEQWLAFSPWLYVPNVRFSVLQNFLTTLIKWWEPSSVCIKVLRIKIYEKHLSSWNTFSNITPRLGRYFPTLNLLITVNFTLVLPSSVTHSCWVWKSPT